MFQRPKASLDLVKEQRREVGQKVSNIREKFKAEESKEKDDKQKLKEQRDYEIFD